MNSTFDEIRRKTLSQTNTEDEKVEVNQRHLIDKILARYSAEYTFYRELMQNSDDAGASAAQIRFYGKETPKPNSKIDLTSKIHRVVFRNNGMPFRGEDWNRLRKIAEGNPDEQKIGAFGVGFYSLFSICEEPFVISGTESMGFYWKGDQLFTKRGNQPESKEEGENWTSFLMDMRVPDRMPDFNEFGKFLARSLGFTFNLKKISVHFNDFTILQLEKKVSPSKPLKFSSKFPTKSKMGYFTLDSVETSPISMTLTKVDPKKLASYGGNNETETLMLFLRVVNGNLKVSLPKDVIVEMERSTKKKPPSKTSIQLMFLSSGEKEMSAMDNPIIKDLAPFPDQGRIFIGFPTHQTTGFSSHLAGRFIPTVERENIDFVDKFLQVWNRELLLMGGCLARIVYEDEMLQIAKSHETAIPKDSHSEDSREQEVLDTVRELLETRAIHLSNFFEIKFSTPSPIVSQMIEMGFFSGFPVISLYSSHGVVPANMIRLPEESFKGFMKNTPVLLKNTMKECAETIKKLEKYGVIKPISAEDVILELQKRVLTESETLALLTWMLQLIKSGRMTQQLHSNLFESLIFKSNNAEKPIQLSQIRYILNPKTIPSDLPQPIDTLPYSVSKQFATQDLQMLNRHWTEMTVPTWASFISTVHSVELTTSPHFSEKILGVLSRCTQKSMELSVGFFKDKDCIVTNVGMKKPSECYFKSVKLLKFDDLPMVVDNKNISEKLLMALGVRTHVDLDIIFERLVHNKTWDHTQLVKYLASIHSSGQLNAAEKDKLAASSIFPGSIRTPSETSYILETSYNYLNGRTKEVKGQEKFRANQLFIPLEMFYELGLPIIQWDGKWRSNSDESKLLHSIGLQFQIPLATLLTIATNNEMNSVRKLAVDYLIYSLKNGEYKDYNPNTVQQAFLPIIPMANSKETQRKPSECYADPECGVMGFPILHPLLRENARLLGVADHPNGDQLIKLLKDSPPRDGKTATLQFEYLATRISQLNRNSLQNISFIPIEEKNILVTPNGCYFKKEGDSLGGEFFDYVDFGEKANSFLKQCGVKDEPSPLELASIVVNNPVEFYNKGGKDQYLAALYMIAANMSSIKSNNSSTAQKLIERMKTAPFLLATKRIPAGAQLTIEEAEREEDQLTYQLASASQISLIDNGVFLKIFSPLYCKQESFLEEFYRSLGSRWISEQVNEKFEVKGGMPEETKRTQSLRDLILERAPLLYDNQKDNIKHDLQFITTTLKFYEYPSIEVKRTFLPTNAVKTQSASVAIVPAAKNWCFIMSKSAELDYFDVAEALSKFILKKSNLQDSFLWSSLLSSSLSVLEKRGLPVDRIINVKQAVAAKIAKEEERKAQMATGMTQAQEGKNIQLLKNMFPQFDEMTIKEVLRAQKEDHFNKALEKLMEMVQNSENGHRGKEEVEEKKPEEKPSSSSSSLFGRLSSWIGGSTPVVPSVVQQAPIPPPPLTNEQKIQKMKNETLPREFNNQLSQSLQRAIQQCRSHGKETVQSHLSVQKVTKSFCDITHGQSLKQAARVSDIEMFVHKSMDPEQILTTYSQPIRKFIVLLKELAQIYGLNNDAIHVYLDSEGPTIAFNSNNSLFFNLRYYMSLNHEENRKEALTYWYLTFAHELAHAFVHEHNSDHEFYLSSFAGEFISGLFNKFNSNLPNESSN
eukprot:TRINITY_DN2815_c0_g1_i4.p1 TRINITY_DN2815_c0_g1~~TRINITY_DN2815_c0_g1_i4.p1  ORF type:complete len:1661 (-),score=588.61 TRINITY_DN2815_c0_g1_i4:79-5061(-)